MFILVVGNPINGLTFMGPFDSSEEATEFAETSFKKEEWWVAPLGGEQITQPISKEEIRCLADLDEADPDDVRDWQNDVINTYTCLGFHEWLEHRQEAERGDS